MNKLLYFMVAVMFSPVLFAQNSVDMVTHMNGDKKVIKIKKGDHPGDELLNLTDEQKKEFKKLDLAFAKETLSAKNELGVKRLELDIEFQEDNPDLKKINSLVDDIHSMEASIEKKRIANEFKKRDLLTDEQKKNWSLHRPMMQEKVLMFKGDVPQDMMWFDESMDPQIERNIEILEK